MNAQEFAKTHQCDEQWIFAMKNRQIPVFTNGQRGTYAGYPATVYRHFFNGMWEIRLPGGLCCVSGHDFIPA